MSHASTVSRLRMLLPLLALTLLPACGEIEVPVTINLDPQADNRLELLEPENIGGQLRVSELVGGVEGSIVLDTDRLLSRDGVVATLRVNAVRIAGTGIVLGDVQPTGTLCLEQDPEMESGGFAFLRPLIKKEADFQLTLSSLVHTTDPSLAFAPPIPFQGTVQSTVPLDLGDLLDLAAGEPGALTITETLQDTLPADLLLVGGSEVTVHVTLTNASEPAQHPLLDECDAYFADPGV